MTFLCIVGILLTGFAGKKYKKYRKIKNRKKNTSPFIY